MPKLSQDAYDAVIIGAGIGGLVCGCYLAKAGMKVLIVEQHHKPGGYCTSFKRKGYNFDAAAHCFGGYREGGKTKAIFDELEISNRLTIIRPDPTDIVVTADYKIPFWNDLNKTIDELQETFPEESNKISDFYRLLLDTKPDSFSRLRSLSFKELLDHYFNNEKLKTILSIPLLAISGLPPSLMSAFIGAKLYSEFFVDGGYYPAGGMQALPDALVARFKELGGELRLSSRVKRMRVKDNTVTGIVGESGDVMQARYVISDCDARQTFFKLLPKQKMGREFYGNIKNMIPSMSNFIIYLGVDKDLKPICKPGTVLFCFPDYNLEKAYMAAKKGDIEGKGGYALRISHDQSTITAIIIAPYKNRTYWTENKYALLEAFIEMIERNSIPDLSKHIVYKDAATPLTLQRYTSNYKGASYGWAGIASQFALPDLRKPSFIQNLYLTGHWSTLGVGISGTAYVGYDTAKIILRKEKAKSG